MSLSQAQLDHVRKIAFELNAELPKSYQQEIYDEGVRSMEHRLAQGAKGNERKVLLIGGAGYIGTVLTGQLLSQGYQVRCLDLLIYNNDSCVTPYLNNPNYEFVFGDLCDENTIESAIKGVHDVIFLAGLVGDPITKKYPEASQKINLDGILKALKKFNGKGLNKVIFISTCSNYGLMNEGTLANETSELKPLSAYARAKVQVELELLAMKDKVDFCATVLRFATAFGLSPRMRFDLTVSEFTREMFLKRDLLVFDAHTWRPYCHVMDFSEILRRVLEAPRARVYFEVFNAGGEKNNATKQSIVDTVKEFIPEAPVSYKEHGTDPRNYRVDFSKIRNTLYFEPRFLVRDGVKELIHAMNQKIFSRVDSNKNFHGNYEIHY